MLKIKKLLSMILTVCMFASISTDVFAIEQQYLQTTDMLKTQLNVPFNLKPGENSTSLNDSLAKNIKNFIQYETQSSSAVFDIRMPKVFTVSKQEARAYGINLFENEIDELSELFDIAPDIDDVDFQTIAKGYALQDTSYTGLAKFIDIYKNYDYNIKMKELISTIETIQYTTADQLFLDENFSTLLSMMPLDKNVYPTTAESHITNPAPSIISLSGYSGTNARAYAQTWAYKTNNTDYGYYANYNNHPTPNNNNMWSGGTGDNARTWNDCANFVSQCLKAGGATTIKKGLILPHQDSGNWYYSDSKPSHTWGGANNFQQHWTSRVGVHSSSADAQVGDPVSLDLNGDNLADHTVIITTVNGTYSNQMLYAGHTSDQFEASGKSLATLYSSYENIWIYSVA